MASPDQDADPSGDRDPDDHVLTDIVDAVTEQAEDGHGDVDTLIRTAGRQGLLPVMTFTALLIVSPLSGVPFVSSVCGTIIAFCALQSALGRGNLWLPGLLRRRQVSPRRIAGAMRRVRRLARWLERNATRRLPMLSAQPFSTLYLLLSAACGLCMPFLELVPMSSSLLALSVTLIGLGLMLRDGLLLSVALLPPFLAAWIVYTVWFT
ncbi:exopolysaccharide biosynthesis protein [Gymnodinialimonas sp. 2305UL16-5]|uniref:exopolysaccharide biosynthesis protein n=1 Tax=Gymnodinialimonas mytili TaxID=3126503 RepID=UPI0030AC2B22